MRTRSPPEIAGTARIERNDARNTLFSCWPFQSVSLDSESERNVPVARGGQVLHCGSARLRSRTGEAEPPLQLCAGRTSPPLRQCAASLAHGEAEPPLQLCAGRTSPPLRQCAASLAHGEAEPPLYSRRETQIPPINITARPGKCKQPVFWPKPKDGYEIVQTNRLRR